LLAKHIRLVPMSGPLDTPGDRESLPEPIRATPVGRAIGSTASVTPVNTTIVAP